MHDARLSRLPARRPLAAACLALLCAGTLAAAEHAQDVPLGGMAEPLDLGLAPRIVPNTTERPASPRTVVVSNCLDSGAGSLRDAILGAAEGETIDLTQLQCSTITLTSGGVIIAQDQLAIRGPGRHALEVHGTRESPYGLLLHLGFGTLIVEDVTLEGGHKYRSDAPALGACIQSQGNVIVRRSTISGCIARSNDAYAALGGGIWSQGSTNLYDSVVTGNFAHASGWGYASGGGVYALGGLFMQSTWIDRNAAISGTISRSFGGGVFARGQAGIYTSTVSANIAGRMGGLALADNGSTTAWIQQSTISGNFAQRIGGIYSRRPLLLYNSTIAANQSEIASAGPSGAEAAGLHMGPQLLTFHSTILADNFATDLGRLDLSGEAGMLNNGSFNLVMATSISPPPDTIGLDPALAPLQDNGGPTPTHALIPGESYAIDAGGAAGVTFQFDQRGRGFARMCGTQTDIGAFEHDPDRIFLNGFDFARGAASRPADG